MSYRDVMPDRRFAITLDPEKYDRIVELARANPTLFQREIAEAVGVSISAVSNILNQSAEEEAEEHREQITDYLAEHPEATDIEVAQHFGLLIHTIRQLKRTPVDRPPQQRALIFGEVGAELRNSIIEWGMAFPDATYPEIADIVGEELGRSLSQTTVQDVLATAGRKLPGMGGRPRISHEKIIDYIRQHPEMSYIAIGKHFGYTDAGIGRIARKAKIPRLGPVNVAQRVPREEIIDYIRQHPEMTYAAVGKHFGYTDGGIRTIALKAGLQRRTGYRFYDHDKSGRRSPRPPQPYRNPQPQWNIEKHCWE